MRAGAARGHVGHFHEAGFYGSDSEFAALIVPFVEEGVAAGEPVIIGYDDRKAGLLRSWLADPSAVELIGDQSLYATPAGAIATYRRMFEFHLAMGAGQIRIAGDVPHPGNGRRFEGWDRYECAINTVWQDIPVWGLCLYDATTAPPAVLDIVGRTHPRLVSPSGQRQASERYQPAPVFEGLPTAPDPLEASAPMVELTGRPAAEARHALAHIGRSRVNNTTLTDLIIGASGPRRTASWSASTTPAPGRPTPWRAWSRQHTAPRIRAWGCGSCTSSTSIPRSSAPATASPSDSAPGRYPADPAIPATRCWMPLTSRRGTRNISAIWRPQPAPQ
jgi:hypothetical protein